MVRVDSREQAHIAWICCLGPGVGGCQKAAPIGGYRATHPSPFDTVRNVSPGNALCQPGCRDEHGRRPDLAGKRQLLSGGIISPSGSRSEGAAARTLPLAPPRRERAPDADAGLKGHGTATTPPDISAA
jgi:hypothetical protein